MHPTVGRVNGRARAVMLSLLAQCRDDPAMAEAVRQNILAIDLQLGR